ncbi:glycosyl transferase [Clostridia bacterium]|nr:glycosyl transferase [Clostridia bacterium]
MPSINMRSSADTVKGQGVGSCYCEQVRLVQEGLPGFDVSVNVPGRFDIVHYHTINLNYYFERLFSRMTLPGKRPTVGICYVHFLPETLEDSLSMPFLMKKIFYKYVLAFYNSMDYLVTVNPFFVDKIRECGITKPRVTCIPNFVSAKEFFPVHTAQKNSYRRRYNIPEDKFVVLGVGQLQTRKGVIDFCETAARCPDTHFIWAGDFSFGKMSRGYDEIKRLRDSKPENVTFLGIVARSDMPAVYNMSDLMFLPSFDELFPMAILEALCCKKPVLVRDLPLYDNILFGNCMTGGDPESFARQIRMVSGNPQSYNIWSEKAWQCHKMYTEEAALKQWTEFYNDAYRFANVAFKRKVIV